MKIGHFIRFKAGLSVENESEDSVTGGEMIAALEAEVARLKALPEAEIVARFEYCGGDSCYACPSCGDDYLVGTDCGCPESSTPEYTFG